MKALKYIYRNLTSDCFSVKYKGKVIRHFTEATLITGSFKVSAKGRERVRREGKKYVHAFVAASGMPGAYLPEQWEGWSLREVTYNPHKNEGFVFKDTGEAAEGTLIVMEYPKVYVLTKN